MHDNIVFVSITRHTQARLANSLFFQFGVIECCWDINDNDILQLLCKIEKITTTYIITVEYLWYIYTYNKMTIKQGYLNTHYYSMYIYIY